jgi:hypothetical protein
VNVEETLKLFGHFFRGFSVQKLTGFWEGQQEESICIEVIVPPTKREIFDEVAERIRVQNEQQSVLVTSEPIEASFVAAS